MTTDYLISMNKNMRTIIDKYNVKYDSPMVRTFPVSLKKYIKNGIEYRADVNCYTYKFVKHFELFYEDKTGNEYSNNKILIENHQEFKNTLNLCIAFIYAIAEILENFQDRFNILKFRI